MSEMPSSDRSPQSTKAARDCAILSLALTSIRKVRNKNTDWPRVIRPIRSPEDRSDPDRTRMLHLSS